MDLEIEHFFLKDKQRAYKQTSLLAKNVFSKKDFELRAYFEPLITNIRRS